MRRSISFFLLLTFISIPGYAQITNEEKALALIAAFESGDQAALDYVSDAKYIQHNLSTPDGKGVLTSFITGQATGITTTTVRSFEVGDIVVTHNVYGGVWNGGVSQVSFDVFRFEEGLIVEHWDNLADIVDDMDGTSQTDGAVTPASDSSSTETNQVLLEDMLKTLFIEGDWTNVRDYFNIDAYVQHSVGAGADGSFLASLEGTTGLPFYEAVKFVYTLGNFGLTMSQGPDITGQDTVGTYAYYDLFRIADGRIVEHWDVIQLIPPMEEWANDNGKWGDDAVNTSSEEHGLIKHLNAINISHAPNPFNTRTRFEVTAAQAGEHHFKVYDITGREVHQRIMSLTKGINQFYFDREHLSNGLYLYRISNDRSVVHGKMILAK